MAYNKMSTTSGEMAECLKRTRRSYMWNMDMEYEHEFLMWNMPNDGVIFYHE